jgi:hypothetical protein
MRNSGSFFFPYFAIVAKKLRCASETCAELRRWPYTNGASNGGAGKNLGTYGRIWVPTKFRLGTYGFAFGYLRTCFLGTYVFSFGYLRIRTASREACGRDQVPNTSLVLQPSDLVCHYLFSQDLDSFIRPFLDVTSREGGFWAVRLGQKRVAWNDRGRKEGRKGLLLTRAPSLRTGRAGCKCKCTNGPGRI